MSVYPAFLPTGIFALFFVFIVVVVVLWIVGHFKEKKRRQELQELAAKKGWSFDERDSRDRPKRYRDFAPFGQGHSRYAFNIMGGTHDGVSFELFDYHYAVTNHSGKTSNTTHHYHKVCVLRMPIHAPDLSIRREHIGHKLMGAVGAGDIDFESDEFSRRFWVTCKDRRFAYDVIHVRMMKFLLANQGWFWEWKGDTLMVHKKGRLRPAKAKDLLKRAAQFHGLLPRHLLAAAKARA